MILKKMIFFQIPYWFIIGLLLYFSYIPFLLCIHCIWLNHTLFYLFPGWEAPRTWRCSMIMLRPEIQERQKPNSPYIDGSSWSPWCGILPATSRCVPSVPVLSHGTRRLTPVCKGDSQPYQPWLIVVTLNLMGPYPRTSWGRIGILVITDQFSQWVEAFSIPEAHRLKRTNLVVTLQTSKTHNTTSVSYTHLDVYKRQGVFLYRFVTAACYFSFVVILF